MQNSVAPSTFHLHFRMSITPIFFSFVLSRHRAWGGQKVLEWHKAHAQGRSRSNTTSMRISLKQNIIVRVFIEYSYLKSTNRHLRDVQW